LNANQPFNNTDDTAFYEQGRDHWGPTHLAYEPEAYYTTLPPLNHCEFINKAKVRFQEGKVFSFYNKLRNVGRLLGVFLVPLDSVKCNSSLCPETIQGFPIHNDRYFAMAASLYEKLCDIDCIPEKYTRIRSIVDHYVDTNDGYQVLYELLEGSHPALDKNPDNTPPKSDACHGDVQEYAAQFQAYVTGEKLNGRHYKEKELVLLFLQGLGEDLMPAIQYVKTLMDSWSDAHSLNPSSHVAASHHTYGSAHVHVASAPATDTSSTKPEDSITTLTQLVQQHVQQSDALIRAAYKPHQGGSTNPSSVTKKSRSAASVHQ
jgi:hypothetical protein